MLDSLFNKVAGLLSAFWMNTSISLYSVLMREKNWKKNCGSFRSLWLWLLMKRCTERCALQLYWTSLIYVHSKSRVTENILNLQEWHQNTKTFLSYKTFTDGKKTKTCQERPNLASGWLIQIFHKAETFQGDHFWVVPIMVVLYRFDCTYIYVSTYMYTHMQIPMYFLTEMCGEWSL